MNLREIWRGTREERGARTTFKRLNSRVEKGQSLSQSQQRRLEESEILSKRLTRRRIIIGGSSALAGSTLLGGGILMLFRNNEHGPIIDFSPGVDINTDAWRSLSAQERLKRLWHNQMPEEQDLDVLHETTLASAEFYCDQVPCKFTPEELASRTVLVKGSEEYLDLLFEHGNVKIWDQNLTRENSKETLLELSTGHTTKDRKVYLNLESIQEIINRGITARPEFAKFAQGSNPFLKIIVYNLLHEFGHMNESSTERTFNKPVILNFINGRAELLGLKGINLMTSYLTSNSNPEEEIASNEALIDVQAFELCRRSGNDIVAYMNNPYNLGRQWVLQLNNLARVEFSDLAKYITGDLLLEDLIVKWGSITLTGNTSNESYDRRFEKGLGIIALIGLHTSGKISADVAYEFIVSQLSTQIQTVPLGPTQPR